MQARSTNFAKMVVRSLILEGLQPMVAEAGVFPRRVEQCRLEVEDSNKSWEITIVVIIAVCFAVMPFATCRLYKHVEHKYEVLRDLLFNRVNEAELRMVGIEYMIDQKEEDEHRLDKLTGYTRRIHCGLVLNGGFVQEQGVGYLSVCSYEMLAQTNAGNYLARRSLEDMRSTAGQYHGHQVMLEAATQGAVHSKTPTRIFKPGNAEYVNSIEHEQEQLNQVCGRLQRTVDSLKHGYKQEEETLIKQTKLPVRQTDMKCC